MRVSGHMAPRERCLWLRFHDPELERAWQQDAAARHAGADLVASLTLTLLFLLLALRVRRAEQPEGVLLQSRAAVLVAALPALLALRDRRLYPAKRSALLLLFVPLTWHLGSTTATAAQLSSAGPLGTERLSFLSMVFQSTAFPFFSQLLLRLPLRLHAPAHALALAVNLRHNVGRLAQGLRPPMVAGSQALAARLHALLRPLPLPGRAAPLPAGVPAVLAAVALCQLGASLAALCVVWAAELRQRRAYAAKHRPAALADLPGGPSWRVIPALLPLLLPLLWQASVALAQWQAPLVEASLTHNPVSET